MNPQNLRDLITRRFSNAGLIGCVDPDGLKIRELSPFFEVSHFEVELCVNDPDAVELAEDLLGRLKRDLLLERGIEVDVLVRSQNPVG